MGLTCWPCRNKTNSIHVLPSSKHASDAAASAPSVKCDRQEPPQVQWHPHTLRLCVIGRGMAIVLRDLSLSSSRFCIGLSQNWTLLQAYGVNSPQHVQDNLPIRMDEQKLMTEWVSSFLTAHQHIKGYSHSALKLFLIKSSVQGTTVLW